MTRRARPGFAGQRTSPRRARSAAARLPGLLLLALLMGAAPGRAGATRFIDLRGSEENEATLEETQEILLSGDPGRLDVILPRAETLESNGEIAFFRQATNVVYDCDPPANLENRSEWYTVLSWYPGSLAGRASVRIRIVTGASCAVSLTGIRDDLSRLPGDYYTSYTRTIEYVPGIEEAIRFIDATEDGTPGLPSGDVGLAERWMAYLLGVIESGSCDAPGRIDGAAWAWNAGVADCDGFSNMFASGMRTLGIPTCVMLGYGLSGGPRIGGDQYWHDTGYHAWAGVWSEGLGRFVPVDMNFGEFGFLSGQRIHFAYLEDLTDFLTFLVSTNDTARWGGRTMNATQTSAAGFYPEVRVRNLLDGFQETLLAHDVTGLHAPGDVGGVDDAHPPLDSGATLRVTNPFHESFSMSLVVPAEDRATVELFDAAGRRVSVLATDRRVRAGESFFRWLPGNAASGVYHVRVTLAASGQVLARRAVRVR